VSAAYHGSSTSPTFYEPNSYHPQSSPPSTGASTSSTPSSSASVASTATASSQGSQASSHKSGYSNPPPQHYSMHAQSHHHSQPPSHQHSNGPEYPQYHSQPQPHQHQVHTAYVVHPAPGEYSGPPSAAASPQQSYHTLRVPSHHHHSQPQHYYPPAPSSGAAASVSGSSNGGGLSSSPPSYAPNTPQFTYSYVSPPQQFHSLAPAVVQASALPPHLHPRASTNGGAAPAVTYSYAAPATTSTTTTSTSTASAASSAAFKQPHYMASQSPNTTIRHVLNPMAASASGHSSFMYYPHHHGAATPTPQSQPSPVTGAYSPLQSPQITPQASPLTHNHSLLLPAYVRANTGAAGAVMNGSTTSSAANSPHYQPQAMYAHNYYMHRMSSVSPMQSPSTPLRTTTGVRAGGGRLSHHSRNLSGGGLSHLHSSQAQHQQHSSHASAAAAPTHHQSSSTSPTAHSATSPTGSGGDGHSPTAGDAAAGNSSAAANQRSNPN
jgi:hypothetical protein